MSYATTSCELFTRLSITALLTMLISCSHQGSPANSDDTADDADAGFPPDAALDGAAAVGAAATQAENVSMTPQRSSPAAPTTDGDRGQADSSATAESSVESGPERWHVHRINNLEYENAIRDLFGIAFSAREILEPDEQVAGFDNIADALDMTPARYVAYFNVAQRVGEAVFDDPDSKARVIRCAPEQPEDAQCARRTLTDLAQRAYRRSVEPEEMDKLMAVYERGRSAGLDFPGGVREAVISVLRSASFLYRSEQRAPTQAPDSIADGYAMAARLSYFLWSAAPDAELLREAREDRLRTAAQLTEQALRMLGDERSIALTKGFAEQWLGLRKLAEHQVDSVTYPKWDNLVRASMITEARLFFREFVDQDVSFREFFRRDVNYTDWRLAELYGTTFRGSTQLDGTLPNEHDRVELLDDERRGFLGLAAFLTQTSLASRTAPTLRGRWLLQNLLCQEIPDPPPDIPGLEESGTQSASVESTNLRERLEAHRKDPACNICHAALDPAGLALEGFDATGRFRELYPDGTSIDTSATWMDGQSLSGFSDLTELLSMDESFLRCMASKVLTYAFGTPFDARTPVVERVFQAWRDDGTFRGLVEATVTSREFRAAQWNSLSEETQ